MENTSLYHYGIKDMRWGVRKYQNKDGSLTPAGKKRYAKARASNSKGAAKNKPKAVVKAKAKTAEDKPKELTLEEKKAKVLASRSAKELYENRKLFDYKEMESAYNLLNKDKQVRDLIVHEPNKVEKFFDKKLIPWAKRVQDLATPVTDTISKVDKLLTQLDPDAKARKAEATEAAVKKSKAEAAKVKAEADKIGAETAKVEAETREATARARTAEAEAKRAESRGKYFRTVKKNSTADADKAESDDSVSGDWLGRENDSGTSSGASTSKKKTTYYDEDYEDHSPRNYPAIDVGKLFSGSLAPSKQTTALVSSNSSTSVAALPAPSSQSQSFVAGFLPAPKKED